MNFQNTTKIHRTKKNKDNTYTCISNQMINDESLSCEAKMVMIYLLSKPDSWIINQTEVQRSLKISRDKCKKAFSILINIGYMDRFQIRDSRGRVTGYDYNLYETSPKSGVSSEINQSTENQLLDIQLLEKHPIVSTDKSNTKKINTDLKDIAIGNDLDGIPSDTYMARYNDSALQDKLIKLIPYESHIMNANGLKVRNDLWLAEYIRINKMTGNELKTELYNIAKLAGKPI